MSMLIRSGKARQPAAGAAARSLKDKVREWVSPEDFYLAVEADWTGAVRRALRYCEESKKECRLLKVYTVSGELEIRKSVLISGTGPGAGYGSLKGYVQKSGFRVYGVGAKRIRTRVLYRGSMADAQDAPLSVAMNVQAENCNFKDFSVFLDFDEADMSPTNLGANWDVGIFNGCRTHFAMSNVHVLGYWREAGYWHDVTRSTGIPEFRDLDGVPFEPGTITNGSDGLRLEKCYFHGGKFGMKKQGSKPKPGLDLLGYRYTVGGSLTVTAKPAVGDSITFAGVVFTFSSSSTNDTDIRIGATLQETASNIADTVEEYIESVMGQSIALAPIKKATYNQEGAVVLISQRLGYNLTLDYTLASSSAAVTVSGATVTAIADPAPYYDQISGITYSDGRGAFGSSDFTATACSFYGTDHHSGYRRHDCTGNPETDPAGGAISIDGMNAGGRIQGMRFFSCRFASWEPFRVKLGRVNRVQMYGCHIESRGACLSTTGTEVNPNDFTTPQAYGQIYASDKTRATLLIGTSGTVNKVWFSPVAQLSLTEFGQASFSPRNRFNGTMRVNSVQSNSGEIEMRSASQTDNLRFRAGSLTMATLGPAGFLITSNIVNPIISAGAGELDLRSASGSGIRIRNGSSTVMTLDATTAIMQVSTLVRPGANNVVKLGDMSSKWSEVFSGNNVINTSDAREKIQRGTLTGAELRAWARVRPVIFQWTDSVARKGNDARLNIGYIAQDVAAAFAAEGLDASSYALWCQDPLFERRTLTRTVQRPKTVKVLEPNEVITVENGVATLRIEYIEHDAPDVVTVPVVGPDGSPVLDDEGAPRMHSYQATEEVSEEYEAEVDTGETRMGLRYEQCLVLECAYLRSLLP